MREIGLTDDGSVLLIEAEPLPKHVAGSDRGVNAMEDVAWYAGWPVAYIYKAKVKKNGTHYRCIWGKVTRPRGNSGVVRVKFKYNLPPRSMVSIV